MKPFNNEDRPAGSDAEEDGFLTGYARDMKTIHAGHYSHFNGKEYEVIGIARHSETEEAMVVYRALYGDGGLWVRPADMWNETIERDGKTFKRFEKL